MHLFSAPIRIIIDLVALGQHHETLSQLFRIRQSTQQLRLKEGGLNFQDQSSLAKQSGAADEVWYHGYHTDWTWRERTGGPTMSRPEDLSQGPITEVV
jgi:hypothetical protein